MPRTKEQFEAIQNESKAKIMEAGLKLFIKRGLLGTSVNEIASLAGISKGLMYHYYKSKEDLYYELVGNAIVSSNEYMYSLLNKDMSPSDKIRLISKTMIEDICKTDNKAQWFMFIIKFMMSENIPEEMSEHINNAYIPFDITEKIIIEGQKSGEFKMNDPKAMSLLYWSSIQGLYLNKMIMGEKFTDVNSNLLDEVIIKCEDI
ncbi:TetR/AcrR family transcriptional regulator [Clostridium sp. 'White wine YQ']|uniref:TetR/AcrR family transcriptional regulator n=1 Tax=Clostridium sp. 'White wine YQ' TaxID=3027474 RepID=UPI002366E74A|nr:TetR/AcrR family transcriptional regulator [Clostridium sp. 'White wine YQ']MDD7796285.1 TetR/AcrR family transcriptional regulator [Clostridium sp. 'White wine YQ']